MSHVSEGALHAYLDGALDELPPTEAEAIREHLDACTECAQRLEAERSVRTSAHAILGLAAPDIEIPSLEELRAYVERTRPRRPVTGRIHRLGWAASIVIAVGAGWMLRDGQLQQRQILQRGDSDGSVETSAPLLERGRTSADLPPAAPVQAEAEEAMVGATVAELDRNSVAGALAKSVDVPAEAVADALSDEVVTGLADMPEVTPSAGAELGPLPGPNPTISPPSIESTTSRMATALAPTAVPDDEAERPAERRRAESLVPVTSAMDRSGSGAYRGATPGEPARIGEPTLAVPGYEVLSVTNLGEGTTSYGAYVIQRLDGNTLLEIFHLDPGVDPGVLPTIGADANEIRLEAESGWVVMRGGLSEAELQALAARILPE